MIKHPNHRLGLCNSAPYNVKFLVAGTPPVPKGKTAASPFLPFKSIDRTIAPGDCEDVDWAYGLSVEDVYVTAKPVEKDPSYKELMRDKQVASFWKKAHSWTPNGERIEACYNDKGKIVRASYLSACVGARFPMGKISFREEKKTFKGHAIRRMIFEVLDPGLQARTPRKHITNARDRSELAQDLAGTLRARNKRFLKVGKPKLVLGISDCGTSQPDDPLVRGVKICSVNKDPPHGRAFAVWPGDTVTHILNVPVFSIQDMQHVMYEFGKKTGPATPLTVRNTRGGYYYAFSFYNPSYWRGCPFPAEHAAFKSALEAATMGFFRNMSDKNYNEALMISQLCPNAHLGGTILGSITSVASLVAKGVFKKVFGKKLAKSMAKGISLRVGTGIMQGIEEFAYAMNTIPADNMNRPRLEEARTMAIVGFSFGFLTSGAASR